MAPHLLKSFNTWIGWALGDLSDLPSAGLPLSRRLTIQSVIPSVRHALGRANEMGCRKRQAMCMRVLNWLHAELRRLPA